MGEGYEKLQSVASVAVSTTNTSHTPIMSIRLQFVAGKSEELAVFHVGHTF